MSEVTNADPKVEEVKTAVADSGIEIKGTDDKTEAPPAADQPAPKKRRGRKEKAKAAKAEKKSRLVILALDATSKTIKLVESTDGNELRFPEVATARRYVRDTESVADGDYAYARILGKSTKVTKQVRQVSLK